MAPPFVPDGAAVETAFARTTHLAVGAHPDDLEVMAYHGIAACYGSEEHWFGGVVVCDGAGSPREKDIPAAAMIVAREKEQRRAAEIGRYGFAATLGLPSAAVRQSLNPSLVLRLAEIFDSTRPQTVYLHSPFDRHETHLAVCAHSLRALQSLPAERRPERILGCEVWRDLDWLCEEDKLRLDVSAHPELARELLDAFGSQIQGGKNYTEAALGRRRAHATFSESHAVDRVQSLAYAVDLRPVVEGAALADFVAAKIDRFKTLAGAAISRWK